MQYKKSRNNETDWQIVQNQIQYQTEYYTEYLINPEMNKECGLH